MKICDMHTHSNYSDGSFSPTELAQEAKRVVAKKQEAKERIFLLFIIFKNLLIFLCFKSRISLEWITTILL